MVQSTEGSSRAASTIARASCPNVASPLQPTLFSTAKRQRLSPSTWWEHANRIAGAREANMPAVQRATMHVHAKALRRMGSKFSVATAWARLTNSRRRSNELRRESTNHA
eukprot:6178819-Pleurochrysis_carterae.AAC.1